MAVQPVERAKQGYERDSDKMGSSLEYLKAQDPAAYYYNKLVADENAYVNDQMWMQAVQRGEAESMIALLTMNQGKQNTTFDQLAAYGDRFDFDSYMLALQVPFLDNTKKVERKDAASGYKFGEFTDQEWALNILNHTVQGWEAELLKERKDNRNWFLKAGGAIIGGINRVTAGMVGFVADITSLGQGLINMFFNFSNDDNWGDRFLYAYSNEGQNFLQDFKEAIDKVNAEWDRQYSFIVDPVKAHEQGYQKGTGSNVFEQISNTSGAGVGMTTWGRWVAAGAESIGYMLPSAMIPLKPVATNPYVVAINPSAKVLGQTAGLSAKTIGAIKTTLYFTGIGSGKVRDSVSYAQMQGNSYKDLNAFQVVTNAALRATAEWAVAQSLGYLMGFTGVDKMIGMGQGATNASVKSVQAATRTGMAAMGTAIGTGLRHIIKEGLENTFQEISSGLINYAYGGQYREQAGQQLSTQNLVDAFMIGALVTVVTGAVKNASVFIPLARFRSIGMNADGSSYKMGAFQTLNMREAMGTMQSWQNTLNDPKASLQAKADAAFKMNAAMSVVGSTMRGMGVDRAVAANKIIDDMINTKAGEAQLAQANMSNAVFANTLFNQFKQEQKNASLKYIVNKPTLAERIQKALEKRGQKLKDAGTTKIDDIVTETTVGADPALTMDAKTVSAMQEAMKSLGAEAIVSVEGNIVTQSDGIIMADKKLVDAGNVPEIIRGITFESAAEATEKALNPSQRKLITDQYSKITGKEGSIQDAIAALLFDRQFYTKVLLLSAERGYKSAALSMLSTLEQIVKAKVSQEVMKGTVAQSAYELLMDKITKNMRDGLVTFATTYNMLDLGAIGNDVLSPELKAIIAQHHNVIFTNEVNTAVKEAHKQPDSKRIQEYDRNIERFATKISATEMEAAKTKARSGDYNARVDAYAFLTQLAKQDGSTNKLIYLPSDPMNMTHANSIGNVENFFGVSWNDLIENKYEASSLTPEATQFIMTNFYDMADNQQRLSAIRDVLFQQSGKTLTIGNDGTVLEVLEKSQFANSRYLGPQGDANLRADIKNGKVKTLGDILKKGLTIDSRLAKLKLQFRNDVKPGTNGHYQDGANYIALSGNDIVNTIMHEATHACQFLTNVGQEIIAGGTTDTFNMLPDKVSKDLQSYLSENFGLTYNYLKSLNASTPQIIYFMLSGEIQANSTMTSHMFELGFRWRDGKTTLVSPDGKKTWSMKPDTKKSITSLIGKMQKTAPKVMPGSEGDMAAKNTDAPINQNYYEGKKFFTGTEVKEGQGTWLSSNKEIADIYGRGQSTAQEVNLTRDEVLRIDARGKDYADVTYKGAVGTDAIVSRIMQEGKFKAVEFVGLTEDGGMKGNTLFLADSKSMKAISSDEAIKDGTRYISNKVAQNSNLKYFIRKGVPIQMDSGVANFVVSTTAEFKSLPKFLQDKILKGELTKFDIIEYVATANKINDFTFKAIAKYVFKNAALAKITHSQMLTVINDIETYAATAAILGDNAANAMSIEQMTAVMNNARATADKAFVRAQKAAQTVKVKHNGKTSFVESHADTKQLNAIFFRHFDGTMQSLIDINNLGKFMATQQSDMSSSVESTGWNWNDKLRRADVDYETDTTVKESVENIDRQTKINTVVDNLTATMIEKIKALSQAERIAGAKEFKTQLDKAIENVHNLSDTELNRRFLAATANETANAADRRSQELAAAPREQQPKTTKNIKDELRNLGRTITKRLAGLKRRYNSLSDNLKTHIDPKTMKLNDNYRNMTDAQLTQLVQEFREASKNLRENIRKSDLARETRQKTAERLERMAERVTKNSQGETVDPKKKKTLREKVEVLHKVNIREHNFDFSSREQATVTVKQLLGTAWDTKRMSTVQGLTNNVEADVSNGKVFFEQNAEALLNMTAAEAEATARWFLDARMNNVTDAESKKFSAVKMYFLSFLLGETGIGKQFYGLNANLKARIEADLKASVTNAGTTLAVWNNVQKLINPYDAMKNADMTIAGVTMTDSEKQALFNAIESNNLEDVTKVQNEIFDRISKEKTQKRDIRRKIVTVRSMAMLSSPMTWLRNRVSNFMLKRLNKMSSAIGNRIFSSKTVAGQLKMTGEITPEIQQFITEHFVDNGFFDKVVGNLSKYDFSKLDSRLKDAKGQASKDAIFANMVVKAMYNQYYSQNIFNSAWMNSIHKGLFKMLSDNSYVREATIRYFGRILSEKGHTLTNGVNDAIMNDFAQAVGQGMSDYMHKDNFFNSIESWLVKNGHENVLFAYKMVLPFASMSWNWFKVGITYSPLGLANSIYKMATLEKQVIKNQARFAEGKSNVSPEMSEWIIRRDMGSGIIGSIAWGLGLMLAGMGYIGMEDDDYGKPKLRIGNLKIDVSAIFGSSSLLAGAALVSEWKKGGMTWDGFMKGFDAMLDVQLDGFFLVDIVQMDMFNRGGHASFTLNYIQQYLLSFIPNIVAYGAGATYTGDVQANSFFAKAAKKIPFMGNILPKKVNPYTGEDSGPWAIFNRMVPYLSVQQRSEMEQDVRGLGLNKQQLRGNYEINGEKWNLNGNQTAEVNRNYGLWNNNALNAFYSGKTRHTVTVNGVKQQLTYTQMNDEQRKATVNSIMSKNANYAKIAAWLKNGGAYYGSAAEIAELRKLGVTGKMFVGNKGFVK